MADTQAPPWDLSEYRQSITPASWPRRMGRIRRIQGLTLEAEGLQVSLGELCEIVSHPLAPQSLSADPVEAESTGVLAEVVGLQLNRCTLMAYSSIDGLAAGAGVIPLGAQSLLGVGPELLGRVIDGFGRALDGLPDPVTSAYRPLRGKPINPMLRPPIRRILETGIRSLDALLTIGEGQRMGIFAGSGVGKSTLLGQIARHVRADVNVIALIGERGREVREFIDRQLGPQGLARSVIVVATSDQSAPARVRAAHAAVCVAEHFREAGQQVLLTMDSVTRLAMARREIGLAAGEPPTTRGYTPSVFAELPQLCERCGTAPSGGAISALMTVLVEGDDLNEPIADSLRSILDGHVVLSRALANSGQYPAIDVLQSASRLLPDLTSPQERALITAAVQQLALLEENRQLVDIGAYEAGSQPALDRALQQAPALRQWLQQQDGGVSRAEALKSLRRILTGDVEAGQARGKAWPPGDTLRHAPNDSSHPGLLSAAAPTRSGGPQ